MPDQNNAPEMPDRIWAWSLNDSLGSSRGWNTSEGDGRVPYIRADRTAPEGQVRAPYAGKIDVGMEFVWEPDDSRARTKIVVTELKASGPEDGPGGELWIRSKASGDSGLGPWNEESRFREAVVLAALTPPPAAPTDNTALVEVLRETDSALSEMGLFENARPRASIRKAIAALASREALPAAPKIEAIFETVDDSVPVTGQTQAPVKRIEHQDDGSFTVVIDHWPSAPPAVQESFCRSCGNTGGVADADDKGEVCWDSCPVCHPPASQQEALAVALKLAAERLQRLALGIPSTTPLRENVFEWAEEALRALTGEQ